MSKKNKTQEKNILNSKSNSKNNNFQDKINHNRFIKSSRVIIILFLIILCLVGFLIYDKVLLSMNFDFLNQSQVESTINDNYQIPLGIFSETKQVEQQDPTISWKVFDFISTSSMEKNFLYSFKYPQEFQIERNNDLISLIPFSTSSDFQLLINFEEYQNDLTKWVEKQDAILATAWEGKPVIEVVTSSDATFMGLPALIRQQKMLAANMMAYVLYFKKDDRVFSISMTTPQLTQELVNFYLTFINTFKF